MAYMEDQFTNRPPADENGSMTDNGTTAIFGNLSVFNTGVFPHPFSYPSVRIIFILLYGLVFAMCFLGNIVVLIVFARSKRMHTRTNLFLANLAVADFCVGVFCVLPNLSVFLSPVWILGQVMCKLYYFVSYLAYTASILLLAVVAVERYIAIMHPLRSRHFFTAPRLFVAQGVVWGVAAVYNIPSLIMFGTYRTKAGLYCFLTSPVFDMTAYYTCHFVLWYALPLVVILAVYGRISCTLWATSAAAADVTTYRRNTGSGSISVTVDANYQLHKQGNGGSNPRATFIASNPARTCVTYCEGLGDNGFGSVVTVGVSAGGGRSANVGGVVGGTANNGHTESRPLLGNRSSPTSGGPDCDENATRVNAGSGRDSRSGVGCCEADKSRQLRSGTGYQTKEVNNQIEMVPLAGKGEGHRAQHDSHQRSHRCSNSHRDDDAFDDRSDMTSTDEYENHSPCGTNADARDGCAKNGGSFDKGGGGGGGGSSSGEGGSGGCGGGGGNSCGTAAGRRRVRYHCRVSSQRGLASRRRVIRLLMAVVTVFGVCVLPFHVRNLLHYWQIKWPADGALDYLSPVASLMMYLNSGLNPFIYWMFSDHFRRSLKETLCSWRRPSCASSGSTLKSARQRQLFSTKHEAI